MPDTSPPRGVVTPGPPGARGPAPDGVLRRPWLLLLAAGVALVLTDPAGWLPTLPAWSARLGLVAKAALFLLFLLANWRDSGRALRSGLVLVLAGLVSNGIPSFAYGAMPYSTRSAALSGMTPEQVGAGSDGHVPVSEIVPGLRPLSDVIPLPGLHTVASVGDALLLLGVVLGTVGVVLDSRSRKRITT